MNDVDGKTQIPLHLIDEIDCGGVATRAGKAEIEKANEKQTKLAYRVAGWSRRTWVSLILLWLLLQ